ncbi:mRNA-degrading endonuclease [Levilactobacillus namurensis]|uniref:type II toxin-antitoxin system PemK/MazF family toxin n=1 Tax=Levilactobacillus namurensis TaxID=380393 RepID=UPI0011957593|nr:type II toxin-antitoxin system PemK/MazF family toxin [Levilactobacillus namurensis]MCW3778745.1 type II toxin-antitoxin system PemK/MazF family toxin [Levilactobacillus namurensis]WNN66763.1 type II toxin-antitoxin system PemK/MazF family toxin [Levilactobacillus namurensis]GEO74358.1 mRNA-degrading endonuclease [Levilactobacillus namurensis]
MVSLLVKKMSGKMPVQGDIVWIDAEPHAGHEYGGHSVVQKNIRRPFLVMSSGVYNERTKMIAGFPITSAVPNGFPMALKINGNKIHGYAILSGLLGYDYVARNGEIVESVSRATRYQAANAIKDIFEMM